MKRKSHLTAMLMRGMTCGLLTLALSGLVGCTGRETPDQIRERTARETAAIKRDSKAVAQGIKQGLSNKRAVDLNKASRAELSDLPGISDKQADHIIAERPYASPHQLVSRHVVSEDEYAKIQDRLVVSR